MHWLYEITNARIFFFPQNKGKNRSNTSAKNLERRAKKTRVRKTTVLWKATDFKTKVFCISQCNMAFSSKEDPPAVQNFGKCTSPLSLHT